MLRAPPVLFRSTRPRRTITSADARHSARRSRGRRDVQGGRLCRGDRPVRRQRGDGMGHVSRCSRSPQSCATRTAAPCSSPYAAEKSAGAAAVRAPDMRSSRSPAATARLRRRAARARGVAYAPPSSATCGRTLLARPSTRFVSGTCARCHRRRYRSPACRHLAFYRRRRRSRRWTGAASHGRQRYAGWNWVLLRREFTEGPIPGAFWARAHDASGSRASDASGAASLSGERHRLG